MGEVKFDRALIVGAGSGLSAALARRLAEEGYKLALAARTTDDLADLAKETKAQTFACLDVGWVDARSLEPHAHFAGAGLGRLDLAEA